MKRRDVAISDAELDGMTGELRQAHNDTRPQFLAAIDDLAGVLREQADRVRSGEHLASTRRNFLRGGLVTAGALGGGLMVAACGSSSDSSTASGAGATTGGESTDLVVARLAASLEVLAVATYGTALTAAGTGAFGTVPPAFANFAQTAQMQHRDHQNAWNSALTAAGLQAQTAPDPKYKAVVDQAVPGLKTIADVASLALTLETVAVETYVKGAQLVTAKSSRQIALTIAPVEAQHVAVLNYVLGKYPVPDTQIGTDMAASPSDLGS
ncbi:MAG TPA: ferritin-like domain-containing protein [Candidatus Dormibacteraeota bacterium]|nr:ferritin-like domain-containing protein [Candidatus Dormibacteraeota bacterium]